MYFPSSTISESTLAAQSFIANPPEGAIRCEPRATVTIDSGRSEREQLDARDDEHQRKDPAENRVWRLGTSVARREPSPREPCNPSGNNADPHLGNPG